MLFALGAVLAGGTALAQTGAPLVAVLIHGTDRELRDRLETLREGLRSLGYVEGRIVRMEVRWSDGQPDRLPGLARERLALQPTVAGAERVGLIASLARPVTGLTSQLDEVTGKQLQFLNEVAPRAKRVMALSSGVGAAEEDVRRGSRTAAKTHGMTLIEALVDTPEKIAQVAVRCEREHCDALPV